MINEMMMGEVKMVGVMRVEMIEMIIMNEVADEVVMDDEILNEVMN